MIIKQNKPIFNKDFIDIWRHNTYNSKSNMIKHFLLFILFATIAFYGNVKAQDSISYINIHQSEAISSLLTKHIQTNEYHPYIDGYRVQLFSVSGVNSRDKANRFKAEFLIKHPDAVVYITYQAPYYKVRIGDFRKKINALAYLQTISKEYPSGFIVKDNILFMKQKDEEETTVEDGNIQDYIKE